MTLRRRAAWALRWLAARLDDRRTPPPCRTTPPDGYDRHPSGGVVVNLGRPPEPEVRFIPLPYERWHRR